MPSPPPGDPSGDDESSDAVDDEHPDPGDRPVRTEKAGPEIVPRTPRDAETARDTWSQPHTDLPTDGGPDTDADGGTD